MKNFEKILVAGAIFGRRRRPPPPVPHDPYETPEGMLYIGEIVTNKEFLYTNAELQMFQRLRGVYTNLPAGDPYSEMPGVRTDADSQTDPNDSAIIPIGPYELGDTEINRPEVIKPVKFSTFNNLGNYINNIPNNQANAKRAVSLSQIKVLDLISEGEIEGLVDGEYKFTTPENGKGIGYTSVTKESYRQVNGVKYLQSIFFNKVPIVDKDGLFNFQQVEVNVTNGSPEGDENGIAVSPNEIKSITDTPLTVVRTIGERLRGPNRKTGAPNDERQVSHFSKYYKILNPNCDGVKINIRFDAFQHRNITGGKFEPVAKGEGYQDSIPTSVTFAVSFRKIFANSTPEKYFRPFRFVVTGKLTSGFIYEFRMPFHKTKKDLQNPNFSGFEIKITRLTPDPITNNIQSKSTIEAITEIYHQKFTYPNSAIVSAKFHSEYFTQIPDRLYDVRLLKVKVPSNYDPLLKKYNGDWDGTFKEQKLWTDNPAWCYYDLLTNKRYGLGDYISEDDVDKWTIYELAKYCDELVSDGEGGFEPRYVCNLRITEATDSYNALQNFSSIFRGFTYYMGGSILCTFDAKRDPIYTFTNANVKDGSFSYQGSASQGRSNAILVRYNDQNNLFQPAIEYIEDPVSIKRNGYIKKDINAFGCTKKSYALRYGKWMMETENTELETVSFTAGLEGLLLRPGDVINISDRNRYARRVGGKVFEIINSGSSASVTLDNVTPLSGNTSYNFTLVTPTYNLDQAVIVTGKATTGSKTFVSTGESGGLSSHFASGIRKPHLQSKTFTANPDTISIVTGFDGAERTKIVFNSKFDQIDHIVSGIYPFFISSNSSGDPIETKQYRIVSIKEETRSEYAINCMEANNEKYNSVDSGSPYVAPIPLPDKPNLQLFSQTLSTLDGISVNSIKYDISPPDNLLSSHKGYVVFVKSGSIWAASDFSNNILADTPPLTEYIIDSFSSEGLETISSRYYVPSDSQNYHFRVYSRNAKGFFSTTPASGSINFTSSSKASKLFSINSLVCSDESFFAFKADQVLLLENQKNIDTTTGSKEAATKIEIGPAYLRAYGQGGEKELITLTKDPRVSWQLSSPNFNTDDENIGNVIVSRSDLTFRISAREPSPNNFPSKFIYFEITGLTTADPGSTEALSAKISYELNRSGIVRNSSSAREVNGLYPVVTHYQFPTPEQLKSRIHSDFYKDFSGDYFSGNEGPFRNYDIVVEAVDSLGNSSVGYNIYNTEPISTFSSRWNLSSHHNSKGYDILELRNPKPEQSILTPQFRLRSAESNFSADSNSTNHYFPNADNILDRNFATLKMLGANKDGATHCLTEQYLTLDGNFFLKFFKDSRGFTDFGDMIDFRDATSAVVLYSNKWFNVNTIKSGAFEGFQINPFEENLYDFKSYTEYKPSASKIKLTNTNRFLTDFNFLTGNSFSYTSNVKAKVINLAISPFTADKTFTMKLNVAQESFISVAFIDAIDEDRKDIIGSDNFDLAILKRSKFYNFSPAVAVSVKGKPPKESAFRAYALFRMTCQTITNTQGNGRQFYSLFGAHALYTREFLQSRLVMPLLQQVYTSMRDGLQPAQISHAGGAPFNSNFQDSSRAGKFPYRVPADANPFRFSQGGKRNQSSFYYPHSVSLEMFSFGFKLSNVIAINDAGNNYGFEVTLLLDEEIPVHNRIVMGSVSTSTRVVDNKTFSVVVPLPYLVAPHGFSYAGVILDDFEFRKIYNIKRIFNDDGSFKDAWSQNVGYVTLVSNGEQDGETIAGENNIIRRSIGRQVVFPQPARNFYYPEGSAEKFPNVRVDDKDLVLGRETPTPIISTPTTPTTSNVL